MINIERFLLVNVGEEAPQFTATALDGNTIDLAKLRGKVVLIDFWATWCAPCLAEMPTIRRAYDEYGPRGFAVIGVSLDFESSMVRRFAESKEVPWPLCALGPEEENPIARAYNVEGIPATFLIGPDGKVIAKQIRGAALTRKLAELFPPEEQASRD